MARILIIFLFCICSSINAQDQVGLTFSHQGGIYENILSLGIAADDPNLIIRYTIDGSVPNEQSILYSQPLVLSTSLYTQADITQIQISPDNLHHPPNIESVPKAIVLRAAAFDENNERISEVITNSYFIKSLGLDHGDLPVVSISAAYEDLFDYENGILVRGTHWDEDNPDWTGNYHQRGKDWERFIRLEMYDADGFPVFHQDAGLRTHGGNVRRHPQKGLRLYARKEYGKSTFEYSVFESNPLSEFKRLVLKPFTSSWTEAGIEDFLSAQMGQTMNIESVSTRPVVLYINGEYWGIYFLQERTDERFVAAHYDLDKDELDLIENWWGAVNSGQATSFNAFIDIVEKGQFVSKSSYDQLADLMDIDNFIDYLILEIFIANRDWPVNNMKCWRAQNEDAKWRWIFFDGDAGFYQIDYDMFSRLLDPGTDEDPNVGRSSLLFRRLIENDAFKEQFLNRMEYVLNNQLEHRQTQTIYASANDLINDEIDDQINRFGVPQTMQKWSNAIDSTNQFLEERTCVIRDQAKQYFGKIFNTTDCEMDVPSELSIAVHPNPFSHLFSINITSDRTGSASLLIHNSMGQVLYKQPLFLQIGENRIEGINVNFPNGLLFYTIIDRSESTTTKVFKYQ